MSAVFQLRSARAGGAVGRADPLDHLRAVAADRRRRAARARRAGHRRARPRLPRPAGPRRRVRDARRDCHDARLRAAAREMLALARMACDVPDGIDDAPVFAAIRSLLDIFDELSAAEPDNRRRLAFLILAASVARTPDVPVPPVCRVAGSSGARVALPDEAQAGERQQVVDLVDRLAGERDDHAGRGRRWRSPGVLAQLVAQPADDPLDLARRSRRRSRCGWRRPSTCRSAPAARRARPWAASRRARRAPRARSRRPG